MCINIVITYDERATAWARALVEHGLGIRACKNKVPISNSEHDAGY